MSKAPSKTGKTTKNVKETKGKPTQSEKQPATLFEIVPGKFNENDWNSMLENDDAQEFIWELIDEIVDNADKQIYKKYIEKQTIPYTINEAKNAIVHLIDWFFLPMDKNEEDLIKISMEDEEPEPPNIDSWAQGYIQTYMDENTEEIEQKEESEEISGESSKNFLQELSNYIEKQPVESENKTSKGTDNYFDSIDSMIIKESHGIMKPQKTHSFKKPQTTFKATDLTTKSLTFEPGQQLQDDKRSSKYDKYAFGSNGTRTPTKTRSKLIESEGKRIENAILKAPAACHSILKSILGRPAGYRELEIDSEGNVISITKIETERVPRLNIKPRVTVIENPKNDDDKVKLNLKKKDKDSVNDEISESQEDSQSFKISDISKIISEEDANILSKHRRKQRFKKRTDIDEYDYLLEPAHGVVYKIGKITRTGPRRGGGSNKPASLLEKYENELKPIRRSSANEARYRLSEELITDSEIMDKQLPKFKNPIPPIPSTNNNNNSRTHVN